MFENLQLKDNLPDIRKVDFIPIEKSYLLLQLIKSLVIFGIFATGFFLFLIPKLKGEITNYIYLLYFILPLIYVLILGILILGFFKKKYAIRQKDISFKKGVLVHSTTTIPFSRIQHIEIDEGAFERIFKLASLSIYTAGDNGRDLKISGIKKDKALQMKELISNYLNDESE